MKQLLLLVVPVFLSAFACGSSSSSSPSTPSTSNNSTGGNSTAITNSCDRSSVGSGSGQHPMVDESCKPINVDIDLQTVSPAVGSSVKIIPSLIVLNTPDGSPFCTYYNNPAWCFQPKVVLCNRNATSPIRIWAYWTASGEVPSQTDASLTAPDQPQNSVRGGFCAVFDLSKMGSPGFFPFKTYSKQWVVWATVGTDYIPFSASAGRYTFDLKYNPMP